MDCGILGKSNRQLYTGGSGDHEILVTHGRTDQISKYYGWWKPDLLLWKQGLTNIEIKQLRIEPAGLD